MIAISNLPSQVSERSDGDKEAGGLQEVDRIETKSSSPRLNSILDPVNGRQSKGFEKDYIINERNLQSPSSTSAGDKMSSAQTIEAGGRMANGQESPVNVAVVENEEAVDSEPDSRRV